MLAIIYTLAIRANDKERSAPSIFILKYLALRPRSGNPLSIVTYPFVHFGMLHVIGNAIALVQLFALYNLLGLPFWTHALIIALVSGIAIKVFGRTATAHGGASGVAIGLWLILVWYAAASPSMLTFVTSIVLLGSLGGVGLSAFRFGRTTSIECHLIGLIIGCIIGAYYFSWPVHDWLNHNVLAPYSKVLDTVTPIWNTWRLWIIDLF